MNIKPECYIISAHTGQYDTTRHVALGNELDRLGYAKKEVAGSYQGTQEQSWLVIAEDYSETRLEIRELLLDYHQECALYLDSNREAYFVYPDGTEEHRGKWVEVSAVQAQKLDGYTRDIARDKYYAIVNKPIAGIVGALDSVN